jgi:hypothetical protein
MGIAIRAIPGLALTVVACAALGGSSPSAENPPSAAGGPAFTLSAGVVVDPAAPVVYLARPEGEVEAFDPVSARVLWRSDDAARPLFALGDLLLAQREVGPGLPLAILDAATGDLRQRLDVPLPDGLRAAIDETHALRFTVSARAVGGAVVLEWEYLERDDLGVSPPDGRPYARREQGAVRVELGDGTARALAEGEVPAAVAAPLPAPVMRLLAAGELRVPPWRVGDVLAATRQIHEPGEQRLVLDRWRADSGEALPEVTLGEGRPVAVLPAADHRHLMVVTALEIVAESPDRYLWTIHSLETGEMVTSRRASRSAVPFYLVQGRLVFREPAFGRRVDGRWEEWPLRLLAVDPRSGEELWERELRDPAFRGPAPPRLPPGTAGPA